VRRLPRLVIRPLPVKAQRRDTPSVLAVRVDLAVRMLVRNHLAASRQADERAVVTPHVLLELAAVPAGETRQRRHAADARHAASAAHFDVIAAREVELARVLLLVEPP